VLLIDLAKAYRLLQSLAPDIRISKIEQSDPKSFTAQAAQLNASVVLFAHSHSTTSLASFLTNDCPSNVDLERRTVVILDFDSTSPNDIGCNSFIIRPIDSTSCKCGLELDDEDSVVQPDTSDETLGALLVFDAVGFVSQAIDELNRSGMLVSEWSIGRYIIDSWSGEMSFNGSEGMRKTRSALVYSSGRVAYSFDGTHLKDVAPTKTALESGLVVKRRDVKAEVFGVPLVYSLTGIVPIPKDDIATLSRYAVFRLNNSGKLPDGVMVMQKIFDDRNVHAIATRAGIDIVNANDSIAVVGSLTSGMSLDLQNVFSTFGLPQLSPSATTPTLSNETLFPTFARISAPSTAKAKVIIGLSLLYNWTRVYMISSTDEFSATIARAINDLAIENNIVIAKHVVVIPELPSYDSALLELASLEPRIIYLMVGVETFTPMIGSMARVGINGAAILNPGLIIAGNTTKYTRPTNTPASFMNGWISVNDPTGFGPRWDAFLDELSALSPIDWPNIHKTVVEAPRLVTIVEAYDVMAKAISTCLATTCDPRDNSQFMASLLTTNTSTLSGYITFDENGDRPPLFDIFNIQNFGLVHVARWETPNNFNFLGPIIWPDGNTTAPLAILPPELRWLSWSSPAGITFFVLAGVGILLCIVTIAIVVIYRNSPAIRPSTWQLLIVTLIGLIIGFISALMWIGKPSKIVCHLRFWLVPLGLTLTFAPLMAKTWRIMMIFRRPMSKSGQPKKLKYPLKELIIIVAILVGLQIVICMLCSILGSFRVIMVPDRANPDKEVWVTCDRTRRNSIFAYVLYAYLGLIVLISAYFAFRARHAWKEWNETAWIARTIYNLMIVASLAIILGYSLHNFPMVVAILIVVFILEISYATYAMTFGPKLWLLLRYPDQRRPVTKSSSPSSAPGPMKCPPSLYQSSSGDQNSPSSATSLPTFVPKGKTEAASPPQGESGPKVSDSTSDSSTSIHFARDKADKQYESELSNMEEFLESGRSMEEDPAMSSVSSSPMQCDPDVE
jgi:ABC-type branched-subunit amino acid transport system substrate-binding protein